MRRQAKNQDAWQTRLQRLAHHIQTLAKKDEAALGRAREILELRHSAVGELHSICADFVASLNHLLPQPLVLFDPAEWNGSASLDEGPNLFQINIRGRILQVAFTPTDELISTEEFRVPYTLEGTIRAFNQKLLDKDIIEEQLLFYTVETHRTMWRFFDPRTYRSGPFDREYLLSLMEQLV